MKIISVGISIDHKNVSNEQFRSTVSFLDFDMLIWNPAKMFYEYGSHYGLYKGCRDLNNDDSPRILGDISRRRNEITELLKLGRIVVLVLPPPEMCYYATGQNTYSGTGRSRITTRIVSELNLLSTIPLKDLQTIIADGDSIEFRGNEPFRTYWERMKGIHHYSAYLSSTIGKPFLFIKGTMKAVASYVQTEKGVFLILPSIFTEEYFKTKKEYTLLCQRFIDALIELSSELKKTTGDDLVMKFGEKVAVVEIKGVSKSAAEKHSAQLEKWVAEYLTSHEVKPKGLLIVNAFCNTSLNNRNEDPFPHQMITYSTNREHCLITTMQLLGIYQMIKSKPETREQLINEIFETNGVYQKFVNYKDYLFEELEPADISENKTESS